MKHQGHADTEASEADIIREVDAMVQSDVPILFEASLGRVGIPYHLVALVSLPYCLQAIDYACTAVRDGTPVRSLCIFMVYQMTNGLAAAPVCLALSTTLASRLVQDDRIGHTGSICIVAIAAVAVLGGSFCLLNTVVKWAIEGGHLELGVFIATLCCYYLAALFFYQPPESNVHRRRLKDE